MAQQLSVRGLDIAKRVFHVVGMAAPGAVVLRQRLARSAWRHFMATLSPLLSGMQACGSAHDWARGVQAHGQAGRLSAPPFVKASVKAPQNEARDAAAIGEAVSRPPRRFVPIHRGEQPTLQALHRVRERLFKARTALVTERRGRLNEYGMLLPQSIAQGRASLVEQVQEAQAKLTTLSRERGWQL